MKSILVTGGCGFIGSNFIRNIVEKHKSIQIINLDKLTYAGNINNINELDKSQHVFIQGDICDSDLLKSLFRKYNFDSIVHFAAESHVDRSIDDPSEFIQTNVVGTLNLLAHSRRF